jgi:hypothetical protein
MANSGCELARHSVALLPSFFRIQGGSGLEYDLTKENALYIGHVKFIRLVPVSPVGATR